MKVLIGTYEIAGLIQQYKRGFEELGHNVTTAVFEKVSWYDFEYDYLLKEIYSRGRDDRKLHSSQYFQRLIRKIRNKRADRSYRNFIFNLIDQHDLIIIFWHPFISTYDEYKYIKKKKKKFVCVFVGSDARYFQTFKQEFDISHFEFPSEFVKSDPEFHLSFIRHAEKYANVIYSLPDQAGLQLRPYNHFHIPLDSSIATFNNPRNNIPKVLHAPSIPYKKGTNIIEKALADLKKEGVEFEFVSIRDMPHKKVLELLSVADVLVDEIVYHGPGVLSLEAFASGCAVATRYFENSPRCFRPPVWPIDANTIYKRLKELLTNFVLRQELIDNGKKYAADHSSVSGVINNILNDLGEARESDYYPVFLRERYLPISDKETNQINHWTKFVADCKWYEINIPKGDRAGLIF